MATFFGEVLSVYSRAVEEDDDDELTQNEEDEQIRHEIEEKRWNTSSSFITCDLLQSNVI